MPRRKLLLAPPGMKRPASAILRFEFSNIGDAGSQQIDRGRMADIRFHWKDRLFRLMKQRPCRQRLAVATRRSSFASSEKAARAVCPQGAACRPSGIPSTDRSIARRPCPRAGALRAPLGDTVGLSVDLPSPRFCGTRAIGAAYALSRRPLSSASRPFIGDLEGQQRGEVSHSRPISTLALRVTITIREGILKYEIRDGASVKSGPIRRV